MSSVFEIVSLDKSAKALTARVSGVDVCLVNALRRIILSKLPNVGFRFDASFHGADQSIQIEQNDSPLHNEYMMHRISLIPIHLSMKEIDEWDPQRYQFRIDKENTTGIPHEEVTTKDIRVIDKETGKEQTGLHERFFPPCSITKDHILLTKLNEGKGSAFRCKMRGEVNTPSTNASFGMVSLCTFSYVVDEKAAEKARDKLRESNAEEDKEEIEKRLRQFETLDVYRKYTVNKYKEPCLFDFKVHSECAITAPEIVSKSIELLSRCITQLIEQEPEAQQISEKLFAVIMTDVTHTEGNVLQAILFNHLVRGDNPSFESAQVPKQLRDYGLTYIGYTNPHPLENKMVIKFTGKHIETLEHARSFFQDGVRHVANYIDAAISEEWIKTYANYKK